MGLVVISIHSRLNHIQRLVNVRLGSMIVRLALEKLACTVATVVSSCKIVRGDICHRGKA
jgi:hypothetical protein